MALIKSFAILGVTQDSTVRDVREAYWALALKMHPDHGGDLQEFQELVDAYKEALNFAQKARCPLCNNGFTVMLDRNFRTITVPCAQCMGTGLRG